MSKYWKRSNDEDFEEFEVEEEETELDLIEDSGYIAVRRITYGKGKSAIKVKVGEVVPKEITNTKKVFENLLSKGAIVKRGE